MPATVATKIIDTILADAGRKDFLSAEVSLADTIILKLTCSSIARPAQAVYGLMM